MIPKLYSVGNIIVPCSSRVRRGSRVRGSWEPWHCLGAAAAGLRRSREVRSAPPPHRFGRGLAEGRGDLCHTTYGDLCDTTNLPSRWSKLLIFACVAPARSFIIDVFSFCSAA